MVKGAVKNVNAEMVQLVIRSMGNVLALIVGQDMIVVQNVLNGRGVETAAIKLHVIKTTHNHPVLLMALVLARRDIKGESKYFYLKEQKCQDIRDITSHSTNVSF